MLYYNQKNMIFALTNHLIINHMEMKKILLLLVCLFSFAVGSFAGDNRPISFNQLPAKAQTFVQHNFQRANILKVFMDEDGDEFEVTLKGGVKIEFGKSGRWKEIESKRNGVPSRVIPERIKNQIRKQYGSRVKVVEISREHDEIEVKLSNGKELKFDRSSRKVEDDD